MTSDRQAWVADVAAAQAGDKAALGRLVAAFLPLVYRLIGRELDGHVDVDDVVQETMVRVVDRLGTLRDPASFRSWLVAVAKNEVRRRWTRRQQVLEPVEPGDQLPDPQADFVEVTILRLGILEARREFAEAVRWLDPEDGELLALWCRENAGELSRAELAAALGISLHHAGVRVQRLKARLTTGRSVVRALAVRPGCPALTAATADRDDAVTPLWRNRIARHVRGCECCCGQQRDLMPVEVLLPGAARTAYLGARSVRHRRAAG
ncbi:sigma-70 family RNA polymerase sigma factor [Kitasatospora sp. NPDC088346]|uniref:sigma-70 family RNA polymerase sigma factor n=1 Tax=Kitasatospora sp. NPDC088346 TaxID=3364073 RepID=UPI00382B7C1E